MEYQSVVIGGCGGAGAGGDGKDDRNKRPFSKVGGGLNNVNDPPTLTCPRCHSTKTKYYYYNNHSLSQPRYYCKGCRRHWTHGGTLRDVPEGGRRRQSKRSRPFESSVAVSATNTASLPQQPLSAMPFFLAVPQPVVFPNNGNMWNFSHQNDVNSSSSLMPPSPLTLFSNTMLNNSLLRGFDEIPIPTYNFMNFYEPAPAEPVLGDLLNVGNDILPLLPPQPEVDDNDDNKNNNNNNNNMGTGGFDEA